MAEQTVETIKMVEKALSVLDALRMERGRLGLNEIAKRCSIIPSTTYRILKTLELDGWVFQCSDDRYIAGEKLSFVIEKNNLYLALKDVSAFTMNAYTAKYGKAMNLIVRDGKTCYVLQQSRTKNLVDYVPPLHAALPFHACAGGKILLAEQPILIVEKLLETTELVAMTPHTITDPEVFWRELRQVAKQGYAFDNKESSENGSCIAVPVRDNQGNTIASLSFSGIMGVEDPQTLVPLVPVLHEAAREISHNLYRCWNEDQA